MQIVTFGPGQPDDLADAPTRVVRPADLSEQREFS
jgi:hypothetical protein